MLQNLMFHFNHSSKQKPGVEVHTCHPSTQEAEAGGFWIPGEPELHNESQADLNYIENKQNSNQGIGNQKSTKALSRPASHLDMRDVLTTRGCVTTAECVLFSMLVSTLVEHLLRFESKEHNTFLTYSNQKKSII